MQIQKKHPNLKIPNTIGPIHFVGIGGIGMSGIAELLNDLGYKVQGSDVHQSPNVERLQKRGIKIKIGHSEQNITHADVVVISSAIKKNNPEINAARKKNIPVIKRAEMLAELMRFKRSLAVAGTHGKTTLTSMIAAILEKANLSPTVINGGIINAYASNARLGDGEWMVVEADESDGSFLKLKPDIAIITNIDPEHMDHYPNFKHVYEAYIKFVEAIPFYGIAVLCADHPKTEKIAKTITDRKILLYGQSKNAHVRLINRNENLIDVEIENEQKQTHIKNIPIAMPGLHNALNATAAIAVADYLGIKTDVIKDALQHFQGVKRRFSYLGKWNNIKIYDDYAHHPVEITATLNAAKEVLKGKIIVVAQPHRFTRLKHLFNAFQKCFKNADQLILAPVYPAGEKPIKGINHKSLAKKITNTKTDIISNPQQLPEIINQYAKPGDNVIFMGAGSVSKWANELPKKLKT